MREILGDILDLTNHPPHASESKLFPSQPVVRLTSWQSSEPSFRTDSDADLKGWLKFPGWSTYNHFSFLKVPP